MDEYIYSKGDFEAAALEGLEDMFGYDLNVLLVDAIMKKLDLYVNVNRFFSRNCPGCVTDNSECDFAYGRNEGRGGWKKAVRGELFDCPVRTNGTTMFTDKGLQPIDIRGEKPYPIVDVGDFGKD